MSGWRGPLASLAAAILAVGPTGCGSGTPAAVHISSSAAIWFHPLPNGSAGANGSVVGGSVDFPSLFQTNAPWPRAMARTKVFGLYAGWVAQASDQDLQQVVAFLNAHEMAIELEAPALQALSSCGTGVEGYVPYGQSLSDFTVAYLQRLRDLGAQHLYIKVDEPYYFGSVVNDPRSCHFSMADVAAQVEQFAALVKSVYPDAAVGDVEPVIDAAYSPNAVTALAQWQDTLRTATGAALPFFIADMDFSNPAWPDLAKGLENHARQSGTPFGIIYIGNPQDTSDEAWTGNAVARFRTYQEQSGGNPDIVLFQSWETHPEFSLPEVDPTTFTGVIDAYIDATM